MARRRLAFAAFTALAVLGAAAPASAATGHGAGVRRMLRFLHAQPTIEHVAVRDVDNDGDLDIIALPRHGGLMLWRNGGHGRFAPVAPPPRAYRIAAHGPRLGRAHPRPDEGGQWDDERYDAAMPRAPAAGAGVVPLSLVRTPDVYVVRPASLRRFSGRAPPVS